MHKLRFQSLSKIKTAVFTLNVIVIVDILVTLNILRNEKSDVSLFIVATSNFAIVTNNL